MKPYRILLLLSAAVLVSCQGWRSESAPLRPHLNMVVQSRHNPQTLSLLPPEGTVAYGTGVLAPSALNREDALRQDPAFYAGKDVSGRPVARIPVKVDEALARRGKDRYDVYCAVCHGGDGVGQSLVASRGLPPLPSLVDGRVKGLNDGELFDVLTRGKGAMVSYAKQVPAVDRWAIVMHLRVLQASRADVNELSGEERGLMVREGTP